MAREYGRIWLSIWSDKDFLRLEARTQRLYLLLISQPGMNTCGVQSYAPNRWASLAPDVTPRHVEADVAKLEAARFVLVDRGTDELLVRSHVRHDRALRTANVAKSLARTWQQIASPALRHTVLLELQRLHAEEGHNGWPGWKVPEIQCLLESPALQPPEPPPEGRSQRPSERSFA